MTHSYVKIILEQLNETYVVNVRHLLRRWNLIGMALQMINLFVREGYLRVQNCILFEKLVVKSVGLSFLCVFATTLHQDMVQCAPYRNATQHGCIHKICIFFFYKTPGIMHPMKIAHTPVPKEMGSLLAENLAQYSILWRLHASASVPQFAAFL